MQPVKENANQLELQTDPQGYAEIALPCPSPLALPSLRVFIDLDDAGAWLAVEVVSQRSVAAATELDLADGRTRELIRRLAGQQTVALVTADGERLTIKNPSHRRRELTAVLEKSARHLERIGRRAK